MLATMPRRPPGPVPDVFDTFSHRVEDPRDRSGAGAPPSAGAVARSAGVTVGLMALGAVGFVLGAWLAAKATPDVAWANPLWEGLAYLLWCGVWGALTGAVVLAAGVVAVGLPWVRRQRGGRATSTSAP
jgi:hypothetical protein